MPTPSPSLARPIDASELLRAAALRHGVQLGVLVAETGLWANPEMHRRLLASGSAAVYPNRRRCRAGQGERRGQTVANIVLDDNSYANNAIKHALGIDRKDLIGFEACHIWPKTCYDERYHTAIANLVLLPRALAGFTDHSAEVKLALQYRAFELYRWHPEGQPPPVQPQDYPRNWLPPMPVPGRPPVTKKVIPTQGRDYTRYDVNVGKRQFPNLPKRKAMLAFVSALVDAGISPFEIASSLPGLANRLFRSADGWLDSKTFIATVARQHESRGKKFDTTRYFCAQDRLIHFGGRTFALTSQWGNWTASTIAALLESFPDCGISVVACG